MLGFFRQVSLEFRVCFRVYIATFRLCSRLRATCGRASIITPSYSTFKSSSGTRKRVEELKAIYIYIFHPLAEMYAAVHEMMVANDAFPVLSFVYRFLSVAEREPRSKGGVEGEAGGGKTDDSELGQGWRRYESFAKHQTQLHRAHGRGDTGIRNFLYR